VEFDTVHQFLAHAADEFALQILETDQYNDAVQSALDETYAWHERNCPLKAPLVLWLILAGVLYRQHSLASILTMVMSQYRQHCRELSLRAITPEAACKARARLGFEPVAAVYQRLAKDIAPEPSFFGFRVWSVDGSFMSAPDTEENERKFGRVLASRGRTAYPQVHVTSLLATTTRQTKDVVINRSDNVDERSDAVSLLKHLGHGDLLLMDIGFSAAWFFQICLERQVSFVARIHKTWKPQIIRTLGDGDYIVRITGSSPRRVRGVQARPSLLLRMIVYQVGDAPPVRLVTNLLDAGLVSAVDVALLYHERWESELTFDEQKIHLMPLQHGKQKSVFRSKTPEGVLQEVYGMLIVHNLVRSLMAEAAAIHDMDPDDISFVETIRLIDFATPAYQHAKSAKRACAVRRQLIDDIADTVNTQPRRPRHYPRVVKIKMSNYECKKAADRGRYRDYKSELRLAEVS